MPGFRSLYEWFAESAARHAARPALEIGGRAWTYRELEVASGRIAALVLRRHGAPPRRMGLLAGRTPGAYAGYLAGLRLGAAVVPLNPAVAVERNRAVAALTGLDAVLAGAAGHPAEVAEAAGATPVPVADGDLAGAAAVPCGRAPRGLPPPVRPEPGDTAYLLFTSGSTGRPKGVPVTHANADAFLGACLGRYPGGPGDRVSQNFELTFDPSVFDLFLGWGRGATVVVPAGNEALRPSLYVNRRRITHWFSVPSAVSLALRAGDLRPGSMPGLRWTLFGGDVLTAAQARAWAAAAPGSVIENTYGPTEFTVFCTAHRLARDPAAWPATSNGTVPIGEPLPGVEHLVLDERGRQAVEGELCLRGPQRFPGYLDPADDAGRFHGREAGGTGTGTGTGPRDGSLWYRTGDRVRREGAGLVHLGRTDRQVKVRGYRVEPGEVEAVLRAHPGVSEAVVVAAGAGADRGLAAFYTGDPVPAAELAALVRASLPAYMLPGRFEFRPDLPRNGNGKLDRDLLATAARAGRAPSQATEVTG
ncbi:AMP-binding protein [Actinomadura fibrosa]|uniref:AMP-binding protein n=1 Tax=Actinomadura fibrosa TaxID=111802 RepID=A0ABW2XPS9_9ACTN|nr:AMP-binding protein [Actinomadura fibrosa]